MVHVCTAIAFFVLLVVPGRAAAKDPDCPSWPTNMAFVHLKNAGLTNNYVTDPSKATAVRLASEKIGKDLYQQVYFITFKVKSGKNIKVITRSEASSEECSMSGVDVYVVSQRLGGE